MAIAWDTTVADALVTAIRTVGKQLTYTPRAVAASLATGLNDPDVAPVKNTDPVLVWGIITDFRTESDYQDGTKILRCKGFLEPVNGLTMRVGDSVADHNRLFKIENIRAEQPANKILVYVAGLIQR